LGAEGPPADGTFGVAFDVDDLGVADADELAAADRTVRADAGHLAGVGELESAGLALGRPQVEAQAQEAPQGEAAPGGLTQEITAVRDRRVGHPSTSSMIPRAGLTLWYPRARTVPRRRAEPTGSDVRPSGWRRCRRLGAREEVNPGRWHRPGRRGTM